MKFKILLLMSALDSRHDSLEDIRQTPGCSIKGEHSFLSP